MPQCHYQSVPVQSILLFYVEKELKQRLVDHQKEVEEEERAMDQMMNTVERYALRVKIA